AIQRTLAIIKPDAVFANKKDDIIAKIKEAEFIIVQERQLHLSLDQARLFYREHEGKHFYDELTRWMSSGPIYALLLEKVNAIQDWRAKMGPTDPVKARDIDPNSIRALFGTDGMGNATHGSDCQTSAEREIQIIFETID
ncbi:nucleoside diphosphate kinase, partial [Circinella umbellata]